MLPTTTNTGGNGQYIGKQHRQWKGKKKISRAIDMILYGFRDRIKQTISTYSVKRERKTCQSMSQNNTQSGTIEKGDQDM